MQIEHVWIALAVILVLLELWAIRGILRSGASSSTRGMWLAIVIFLPLFGMLAWLGFGPKRVSAR
ncbi:PLDc N-terminal domain-containing protein [Pseudomonas sp.]|uniref:PLDc N-terminal domain-containing protein n=1 Tax=Pseudomonas sp. TaxID=306 RepID=UPI00260BD0AE|nr:PLDc N-terminal domain-containing protein [Pseudomonas sp.]